MDIITEFFQTIFYIFNRIFYFVALFFAATPAETHIYKIGFVALIIFLLYTALRPARWKWIVLYTAEAVFFFGSVCLFASGWTDDSLGFIGYGAVSAALGLILLFITMGCSLRKNT